MQFYIYWSLSINVAVHLLHFIINSASSQLYVGCYKKFSGLSSNKISSQSVLQCLNECRIQTSLFAAIKDGSSCYCGNITNTRVPSSNCNLTCADNNGTCGGNNLYAVYTDISTYQGCFNRFSTSGNRNYARVESIDECYETCLSLNYRFFGIGISYWMVVNQLVYDQLLFYCSCADTYMGLERVSESECVMCFRDKNLKCGGYRSDNMSIYSVGHLPSLNKSYSEVFHCHGGVTFKNGTCNSTFCKNGWKGAKCNQRECRGYNGKCGDHKCEDINIGNQIISECVCKEGFQSISIYDECTDIDECQNNPCNEPSETCINTIGSFMCVCSPGYNYAYLSDCGVRCNGSLYSCENTTSCIRISNYICSLEVHAYDGKNTVIILGVFLALCLCAVIICTAAIFICGKKLKGTESKLENLQKTIPENGMIYSSITPQMSNHEDHNYTQLRFNKI